jgi:hypothetical protein
MALDKVVSASLDDMVGKCFEINRMLDRAVSILAVKFNMPRTSDLVHHHLAHPIIGTDYGDSIGDYKTKMNELTVYKATPVGDTDYTSPLEIFVRYQKMIFDLRNTAYDAFEDAQEAKDHETRVFVDGFISRLDVLVDQAQTLVDMFTDYGSDPFHLQLLDSNIEKYITVKE